MSLVSCGRIDVAVGLDFENNSLSYPVLFGMEVFKFNPFIKTCSSLRSLLG